MRDSAPRINPKRPPHLAVHWSNVPPVKLNKFPKVKICVKCVLAWSSLVNTPQYNMQMTWIRYHWTVCQAHWTDNTLKVSPKIDYFLNMTETPWWIQIANPITHLRALSSRLLVFNFQLHERRELFFLTISSSIKFLSISSFNILGF